MNGLLSLITLTSPLPLPLPRQRWLSKFSNSNSNSNFQFVYIDNERLFGSLSPSPSPTSSLLRPNRRSTHPPIHQSASHINQNTRGLLNTLPTATRTGNGDCHSDYTTNDDDDECSHISLSCSHCNSVGTFDRVIVNHPLIGIAWTSLLSLRIVVVVVVIVVVASHHPYFEYSSQLEHCS